MDTIILNYLKYLVDKEVGAIEFELIKRTGMAYMSGKLKQDTYNLNKKILKAFLIDKYNHYSIRLKAMETMDFELLNKF